MLANVNIDLLRQKKLISAGMLSNLTSNSASIAAAIEALIESIQIAQFFIIDPDRYISGVTTQGCITEYVVEPVAQDADALARSFLHCQNVLHTPLADDFILSDADAVAGARFDTGPSSRIIVGRALVVGIANRQWRTPKISSAILLQQLRFNQRGS